VRDITASGIQSAHDAVHSSLCMRSELKIEFLLFPNPRPMRVGSIRHIGPAPTTKTAIEGPTPSKRGKKRQQTTAPSQPDALLQTAVDLTCEQTEIAPHKLKKPITKVPAYTHSHEDEEEKKSE